MDELRKARCGMDKMRAHQVFNPCRTFAVAILPKLDLQNCVWELGDLALVDVLERVHHIGVINISSVPLIRITAGAPGVKGVLANKGQIRVDRNANTVIRWFLESRADVVGADDG